MKSLFLVLPLAIITTAASAQQSTLEEMSRNIGFAYGSARTTNN